ncbi:MAG: class I SAM-dependent methyltransferase [Verrucomicrobiae bacterium]|nr:class I SAM-dependent methyltransferase [Verrucomicrobiae bacterium]
MSDPRTPERIRHHFEVERELATRMRASTREERTELFKTLYTELFERVPDHPRLTRRETPEESSKGVENQLRLVKRHLSGSVVFLEIAPGDCRLGHAAARLSRKVIGVDISDQRSKGDASPENFELVVYDGYHLDLPPESIDVAFSYQFLEHLHPDDVDGHFELIHRLLKPGGVYVFDTPHRYSGPHDVSRFFGDSLQCFHFQEWTYREMIGLLKRHGFDRAWIHRKGREWRSPLFLWITLGVESCVGCLPKQWRQKIATKIFPSVTLTGHKSAA